MFDNTTWVVYRQPRTDLECVADEHSDDPGRRLVDASMMAGADFEERVAGVASLAEPQRRALYRYVVARADAVSRDEAATAMGVPRSVAAFHLDRLAADGLLTTEYRRLSG